MPVRAIITEGTRADCKGGYTPYRGNRRPKSSGRSWLWHIGNRCFCVFGRNKRCHPAQEEPKGTARIRPLSLQNQASCRECFSVVKTLEGIATRYAKTRPRSFLLFTSDARYWAGCFDLISSRHYLDDLFSHKPARDEAQRGKGAGNPIGRAASFRSPSV